jgi:hypothetical protein
VTAPRTLEIVKAMERRARARLMSAALQSRQIEAQRRLVRSESADRLRRFETGRRHCAFSCSIAAARDAADRSEDATLMAEERTASAAQTHAADALLPWARLRIGLERRQARKAGADPR